MGQQRRRGQKGFVREESGQWRGYFNLKIIDAATGLTKYRQQSVLLGPAEKPLSASKLKAYDLLRAEIQRVTGGGLGARPDGTITLEKFTRERWLPLREAKWRPSSKASAMHTLSHIFGKFGAVPLDQLDKVVMQSWLNDLAKTHSKSLVLHAKFYLKSILSEANDQGYISRSPANKLESPRTTAVSKDTLTIEQYRAVVKALEEPYDLMVQIAVACAFRPSELLALRWRDLDVKAQVFHIRETVYRGEIRPFTKTTEEGETNQTLLTVPIPDALIKALVEYRGLEDKLPAPLTAAFVRHKLLEPGQRPTFKVIDREKMILDRYVKDDNFIFHNLENGNFFNKENILFRVFRPVAEKLKLPALNFQVLRRTAATVAQHNGSVKDVQTLLRHRHADVTANEYMQGLSETTKTMVNEVFEKLNEAE